MGEAAAVDPTRLRTWFASRGWTPWPYQEAAWSAFLGGMSGLIHVPTGAGKTYAAFLGPLCEAVERGPGALRILYVSPLRAVSRDVARAMEQPIEDLGLPLEVGIRTGDTGSRDRARQRKKLPEVLVTTPESLALLIGQEGAARRFAGLCGIIVDEWHELVGGKRGALLQLTLARVRRHAPAARTWALSATLGNVDEAARAILPRGREPTIITADLDRPVEIRSLLPEGLDGFPWAGHLGLSMLRPLVELLADEVPTLVFTNTRFQAETWYREVLAARPEWDGRVALHHGSLERDEREAAERGIKDGTLMAVIATSSLDLGVDFPAVDRVVQIGSPKGIARLLQRAGRAAHRPGAACRLWFLPTNGLELLEIAAARDAVARGRVESRHAPNRPLDVLAQHLVTCALGEGFTRQEVADEVRTAASFADLRDDELDWTLDLVVRGGRTLGAYPDFHKVEEIDGVYRVTKRRIAQLHRMNVGTISSDQSLVVRYLGGKSLGTVEETFLSRLKRGDRFWFAGRSLELVRLEDGIARVKKAPVGDARTPQWMGGRMPLSTRLGEAVREVLSASDAAEIPELACAAPLIRAQRELSALPGADALLVETARTRDGEHLFLYPFEGRLVHEGLAVLLALRFSRRRPGTFSVTVNDYGVHLVSADPYPWLTHLDAGLFDQEDLLEDFAEGMNLSEMMMRQFRGIARVAGLVIQNAPGRAKSARQVQASASLLFQVFERYDPENLLLEQARREVLERHFEQDRLAAALRRLERSRLVTRVLPRLSPLAFPLAVEQIRGRVSNESLLDRIERLKRPCLAADSISSSTAPR